MPPVYTPSARAVRTLLGDHQLDAPTPGKVDWDNFTTVERQRAALAWVDAVLTLIVERNGGCSIVGLIQYYLELFKPEYFPDREGKLPVTDFALMLNLHDNYKTDATFRMMHALIRDIGLVWLESTMDGRGLVYRLRNMAPGWQVDKEELEALAAVLLT